MAAGLTGAAAGGLTGSLVDMGIPEDRGNYYEEEVKEGNIVAVIEAKDEMVNEVVDSLENNGARDVESH